MNREDPGNEVDLIDKFDVMFAVDTRSVSWDLGTVRMCYSIQWILCNVICLSLNTFDLPTT